MALGFSSYVTYFHGSTLAMTFEFSRISKAQLATSVKYFQRHFLNQIACFFFLKQIPDRQIDLLFWVLRYPAQCTGLDLLSEPPQNKIGYRLHPKYTFFSGFPTICSPAVWKSFLQNSNYLRHFWYLEGHFMNDITSFCRQLRLRADFFLVHFRKV